LGLISKTEEHGGKLVLSLIRYICLMTISPRNLLSLLSFFFLSIKATAQEPPVLNASGNQLYCPGTAIRIVESLSITSPDSNDALAVYIQISSGYAMGQDNLQLSGTHPNIQANWDVQAGKLTLKSPGNSPVTYADFISAVEDVLFTNNTAEPSGTRTFSISIGEANYLPSTGHYYRFIPNLGITWTNARALAEQSTYYGLQGYLATLGSAEEAKLCGEQSSGAGWIGGSDQEQEGVWKWVTGPEAGTIFWTGEVNGSTPNFAFWNNYEPNNLGEEDYAHITAPGVGIPGSWNDLSNQGADSGDYQPKGYIVEYGGMPGDPELHISTSTTLNMPRILSVTPVSICGSGTATLGASSDSGVVNWYDSATGGSVIHTGDTFTTPVLSTSTTFYVNAHDSSCSSAPRIPVTATVNDIPVVTADIPAPSCEGIVQLQATTTAGQIRWYSAPTGDDSFLGSGTTYTTSALVESTTYYVDAVNNGCSTPVRTPVPVSILPKPYSPDEQLILCEATSLNLDAGITGAAYQWSGSSVDTRTLRIESAGIYTVVITNPEGCSTTKTFTVIEKQLPRIKNVSVDNTTVTVNLENSGDFEYSVDGINFQDSNVFTVDTPGLNTAFVRGKHGCGEAAISEFLVIIAPGFFTPNGDSHNDVWTARGMNYLPDPYIAIFDRYGKLVAELNKANMSWNGTYGGRNLPAGEYWYIFRTSATATEVRGHFSLVR
jgi:gliding motility-associated-like protein